MGRCSYCAYRNSWDCDDGWNRKSNDTYCEEFSLDFNTLSEKQKKAIQRKLMNNENHDYY